MGEEGRGEGWDERKRRFERRGSVREGLRPGEVKMVEAGRWEGEGTGKWSIEMWRQL